MDMNGQMDEQTDRRVCGWTDKMIDHEETYCFIPPGKVLLLYIRSTLYRESAATTALSKLCI